MLPIVLFALASAGQYAPAPPPPTVVACRDAACPTPALAQYPTGYPIATPQVPQKSPPLGIPPAPPKSPPLGIPPSPTPQYLPPPVATPQYGYGPAQDVTPVGIGVLGGGAKLNGKKILFKRNQGLGRLGASGTVEANSRKRIVFKNNSF